MTAEIKTAIGLMSGTSMDGIDVALIRTDGQSHVAYGPTGHFAFTAAETQAITVALDDAKSITGRHERPGCLGDVEQMVTIRHAEAVRSFCHSHGLAAGDVDVIGFHGQTVLHRPNERLTVQLGDGAALAAATGIDVVFDMRANDMANGGQGAPLVPVFHQAIAPAQKAVAFVNIGGIANVTFVQPDLPPVAFDCGPGNALIDQWMQAHTGQRIDEGGALALSGRPNESVIDAALAHDFFAAAYPKSLDRNDFTLAMMPEMAAADGCATLAKLTARAIAKAAQTADVSVSQWILSGGGAHNDAIVGHLRDAVGAAEVTKADALGYYVDDMEAQAWAYLAVRSLRGLALTFPSTTGCVVPVTGGVLAKPR